MEISPITEDGAHNRSIQKKKVCGYVYPTNMFQQSSL